MADARAHYKSKFNPNSLLVDTSVESENIEGTLQTLRKKYPNNLTLGYININSVRHKLKDFFDYIQENINIVAIAETKIDSSFPQSQFLIKGMKKPYRLDKTAKSGGLLVYVDQKISSRQLYPKSLNISKIQVIVTEINLQKQQFSAVFIYRPFRSIERSFG